MKPNGIFLINKSEEIIFVVECAQKWREHLIGKELIMVDDENLQSKNKIKIKIKINKKIILKDYVAMIFRRINKGTKNEVFHKGFLQ